MKPGKMRHRITIQQSTQTQNSFGEPIDSWSTFAGPLWAAVEPIQGREFWAQQQVQSEVTIRVRIRYLSGVTSSMRILYGARILTIESVIDPKEGHKEMQLMCSEGVKNA
jgi:SPP1 family predicted phage head-tail adaptor